MNHTVTHEARMFCTNPLIWVPCIIDDSGRIVERTDLGLWLDKAKAEAVALTNAPHMMHFNATCDACAGSGWAETVEDHVCTRCAGRGNVWKPRTRSGK